jgi:hypothetical protein
VKLVLEGGRVGRDIDAARGACVCGIGAGG